MDKFYQVVSDSDYAFKGRESHLAFFTTEEEAIEYAEEILPTTSFEIIVYTCAFGTGSSQCEVWRKRGTLF